MLIGVDASKITDEQKTGVENTVYSLLFELLKLDKKNAYNFYTAKFLGQKFTKFPNLRERLIPFPRLWHKFRLPLALVKDKPDLFIELSNPLPALCPKMSIAMIHDIAFKIAPEGYSSSDLAIQDGAVKNAVKNAAKIILTSQANVDDLIRFYPCPKEKIAVIPLAYDSGVFKKTSLSKEAERMDEPYFLHVGRLEAKKNIINIIKAFYELKKGSGSNVKLIFAGKKSRGFEDIEKEINRNDKFKSDIIIKGFVSDKGLAILYSNAIALVFPSLYEGFGLPVLEAFACGLPVITSDTPPLKETAGDAALFVDPYDIEDISQKMTQIYSNKKLRQDLIKKGNAQKNKFSWQKSAQKLFEVIGELDGK